MNFVIMVIIFNYVHYCFRKESEFKNGVFKWMEMQEKMNPERLNAELHRVLEELKKENV